MDRFLASCRELNRSSVSKIGPEPAKPTISLALIIIDFWLSCRYRGHIHNSGPPSRQLACSMHGRSHTRSPSVSIMRVDSWELPLSSIPLCQLLPSHLGPPRPTLSINLYVKGWYVFNHTGIWWFHCTQPFIIIRLWHPDMAEIPKVFMRLKHIFGSCMDFRMDGCAGGFGFSAIWAASWWNF